MKFLGVLIDVSVQRQPFLRGNGRLVEVDSWRERSGRTLALWAGTLEILVSIATHSNKNCEETDDYPEECASPGDPDHGP